MFNEHTHATTHPPPSAVVAENEAAVDKVIVARFYYNVGFYAFFRAIQIYVLPETFREPK